MININFGIFQSKMGYKLKGLYFSEVKIWENVETGRHLLFSKYLNFSHSQKEVISLTSLIVSCLTGDTLN